MGFQRCAPWVLFQDGRARPWILQRQVPRYQGREARKEGGSGQGRRWQYHQERQKRREKGCQRREAGEGRWRCQGREKREGAWRCQRRKERKSTRRSQERKDGEEVILFPLQLLWRCVTPFLLLAARSWFSL